MSTPPGGSSNLELEITVLVADYEATREDQRQGSLRQAALLSAGIAVFAAFYYLTAENREFLRGQPLLAILLPLAPYIIAQAYVWYEIDTVLRGYYIRALERAIQERISVSSGLGPAIPLPSIGHLSHILAAPRHYSGSVRMMNVVAWVAIVALFGASAVLAILTLDDWVDRVFAIALYAGLTALLYTVAREYIFSRARVGFGRVLRRYPRARMQSLRGHVRGGMSGRAKVIVQYLLLPRAADLVKWSAFVTVTAISLLLGIVVGKVDLSQVPRILGLSLAYLVLFEYLIYQARYQWNDLRGAERETQHVSQRERRRLPNGSERSSGYWVRLKLPDSAVIILGRRGVSAS